MSRPDTTSPDGPRSALFRLGAWSARRPLPVLGAWLLLLAGALLLSLTDLSGQTLFQRLDNGEPRVEGEAAEADALLESASGQEGAPLFLLVHGVDPLDESLRQALEPLPRELDAVAAARPEAEVELQDPRQALAARERGLPVPPEAQAALRTAMAEDGRGVLLRVEVRARDAGEPEAADRIEAAAAEAGLDALDAAAERVREALPEATVHVSSASRVGDSYRDVAARDLQRGEGIALPIALAIMILVFGGFLAAGLPVLGALLTIGTGLGVLFALSGLMDFDSMVLNVISLLGLALSIDYGLLVISRFREEAAGLERGDRAGLLRAVGATTEQAGRTVLFSGVVFAAASAGLLLFEPTIIRAIGLGVIIVAIVTVLASVTFMPALLGLLGFRLARPGLVARLLGERNPISRLGAPAAPDGFFGRLARLAQRRPALTTLGSLLILGIVAAPALALNPANDASGAIPRAAGQFGFLETLRTEFPEAARPQLRIVVDAEGDSAEAAGIAEQWADAVREDARIEGVGPVVRSGGLASIVLTPAEGERAAAVGLVRDAAPAQPGVRALTTGAAAHERDLVDSILASVPAAALLILGSAFVLLFLMTGSVVMPLKSLFIAVFSLGSAAGLLVWGFQQGNLAGPLGFQAEDVGGVDVLVLTITLVMGFGLSMDYEVFLLGRVVELRDAGLPAREAVWRGMQSTGRIITSAALIMVTVFLGFTVGELMVIKQLGCALALLVALDASLVRCVLVPALMTWQERIMWWCPRWLQPVAERFRIRH